VTVMTSADNVSKLHSSDVQVTCISRPGPSFGPAEPSVVWILSTQIAAVQMLKETTSALQSLNLIIVHERSAPGPLYWH
jgi:hypothetical protein